MMRLTIPTPDPFVSVIIPVYNGEKFIREAIESVLQQNYQSLEILVIDDGSTDRTAHWVGDFGQKIRYFFQSNRGPSAARNKGLELSQGEVIAFLDADDLWPLHKLENQIPPLLENPSIDVVLGRIQCLESSGTMKSDFSKSQNTFIDVHLGGGIFRKSVFDKVGRFDETLRYSEDHDWFLRAREQTISILLLEEVTLYYRLHQSNMTRNKEHKGFQLPNVLKKSLERRRSQNKNNRIALSLARLSSYGKAQESTDFEPD